MYKHVYFSVLNYHSVNGGVRLLFVSANSTPGARSVSLQLISLNEVYQTDHLERLYRYLNVKLLS